MSLGTLVHSSVDFLLILLVTTMRDSDITTGSQFASGQSSREE